MHGILYLHCPRMPISSNLFHATANLPSPWKMLGGKVVTKQTEKPPISAAGTGCHRLFTVSEARHPHGLNIRCKRGGGVVDEACAMR